MTEVQQASEQVYEPGSQGVTVGQLLRDARERVPLSAADVARQLRLGLRQIEALEANDFAALPGNTIVRGFIRNYAKLLQVDPTAFLAAYEASLPTVHTEKIAVTAENIDISPRPSRRWVWYVGTIAAVVIGAPLLIYALLHDDGAHTVVVPTRSASSSAGQVELPMALPSPSPIPSGPVEGSAGGEGAAVSPAAPAAPAVPGQSEAPAKLEAPKSTAGPGIHLVFDDDAWVEIRDRSGKRIFSQLNRKGAEEAISGEAPFALVIGNAAKVRITYNGKPVDLQPYIKVNVARLTLE
jgi:cytoskeleton protein RodZ